MATRERPRPQRGSAGHNRHPAAIPPTDRRRSRQGGRHRRAHHARRVNRHYKSQIAMISIVTPAFNEATNLPALYERLVAAMRDVSAEWEWIVVDDHSRDETFAVIEALALRDARVRGFRLSRNSGSHVAITCGLHQVESDAAVMMAAALQDPPETLASM